MPMESGRLLILFYFICLQELTGYGTRRASMEECAHAASDFFVTRTCEEKFPFASYLAMCHSGGGLGYAHHGESDTVHHIPVP
jgi:hypothetical protein